MRLMTSIILFFFCLGGIAGAYNLIRSSIVNLLFEIFVRSANHAETKKQNSLILFTVNLGEAKIA